MMEKQTLTGWDNKKRPVERGYPPDVVQRYCVNHYLWQRFRLSLKGLPTHEKLRKLELWWDELTDGNFTHESQMATLKKIVEVQVGNYLGALRRGGQLDADNQIRKYI
jgi:hypothetical protein